MAVGVSAAVTVAYTMFGQMVSVAYTDALQFVCMAFGLVCKEINGFVEARTRLLTHVRNDIFLIGKTTTYN